MASGTTPKYADGTDTGWIENKGIDGDSKNFIGSIFYRRQGDIVFVRGYGVKVKTAISASSYTLLMTLDPTYCPVNSTGSSAMTNYGSGSMDRVFPVLIAKGGQLYVYANSDTQITPDMNINFNFVYSAN